MVTGYTNNLPFPPPKKKKYPPLPDTPYSALHEIKKRTPSQVWNNLPTILCRACTKPQTKSKERRTHLHFEDSFKLLQFPLLLLGFWVGAVLLYLCEERPGDVQHLLELFRLLQLHMTIFVTVVFGKQFEEPKTRRRKILKIRTM